MTNTYINGCVRGLTQHLRQRCRKREVFYYGPVGNTAEEVAPSSATTETQPSPGKGHMKVPGQLVGPVNLGLPWTTCPQS